METYVEPGGNFVRVLTERARWKFLLKVSLKGFKTWYAIKEIKKNKQMNLTTVRLPDAGSDFFITSIIRTPRGTIRPFVSGVPNWVLEGLLYYQAFGLEDESGYD